MLKVTLFFSTYSIYMYIRLNINKIDSGWIIVKESLHLSCFHIEIRSPEF